MILIFKQNGYPLWVSDFFAYGLLAATAAVVVAAVVAVSAAANEDEDYYKNPSAAVTTETIITHIKDLLFCLHHILC